jgi:hypothetical protein
MLIICRHGKFLGCGGSDLRQYCRQACEKCRLRFFSDNSALTEIINDGAISCQARK